jgi:hypothetical protein
VVSAVGGRAIEVVAQVAHAARAEAVGFAGGGLGVFAGGSAVEHRGPADPVGAHLGFDLVVGAPIGGVVEHLDLVHAVSRSQVELHVMQAGAGGVCKLAAGSDAAVSPGIAVAGHFHPIKSGVSCEGLSGYQVVTTLIG